MRGGFNSYRVYMEDEQIAIMVWEDDGGLILQINMEVSPSGLWYNFAKVERVKPP